MTRDEALGLRSLADGVRVAPEVREYIAAITRATRDESALSLGASPRATVALMRAARANAVLAGRAFVVPDDVKSLFVPLAHHRVVVTPSAEMEGVRSGAILAEILGQIPPPR